VWHLLFHVGGKAINLKEMRKEKREKKKMKSTNTVFGVP
jgi:hypothetical protein